MIVVVSFLAVPGVAQEATPAKTDKGKSARIEFSDTIHDYGTIAKGSDGLCEFTFTNTGNIPLILSNVKTSCGCVNPSWSGEPVLPVEQGKINMKYYTTSSVRFLRYLAVTSSAVNSKVVLKVKGTVK